MELVTLYKVHTCPNPQPSLYVGVFLFQQVLWHRTELEYMQMYRYACRFAWEDLHPVADVLSFASLTGPPAWTGSFCNVALHCFLFSFSYFTVLFSHLA